MQAAKILLTPTFSLRQHCLEKTPLLFDTVIFDDASMINETDCLSALSHGANRAILLGNRDLTQNMFLVNPSALNKTLFNRGVNNAIELEKVVAPTSSSAKNSPPKKRGSKSKQEVVKAIIEPEITFIESVVGTEQEKKGSYENFKEANLIADYLVAFKD